MQQLFTYGSLKRRDVQEKVFERYDPGLPDSLEGYTQTTINFNNNEYQILEKGDNTIHGVIIEVTKHELEKIDAYETDHYKRIQVTLKSGREVWVYVKH